jgi:hypothetical protein
MQADNEAVRDCLRAWLGRRLAPDALEWLGDRCAAARRDGADRSFFLAFSAANRHTGKEPLALSDAELDAVDQVRPRWRPAHWTCDQAARTLLVTSLPHRDVEEFVTALDKLFLAADIGELVALYQALPVLPWPKALGARCAEGARSNMTQVFRAVAHDNPYPSEYLDEGAWNQMVLKALFVGVALDPILGLDERANPALARMLCDYAHERWAADRPVSPELWRCVGPHADDGAITDLERVLRGDDETSRRAAALALGSSLHPEAARVLQQYSVDLPDDLDWTDLAEKE